MGSDPVIVYISSDDEGGDERDGNGGESRAGDGFDGVLWRKRGFRDCESDDDCLVLDSDPDKELVAADGDGCDSDDLVIVNEKGQVACRDYPHSRHLCANYPFNASQHNEHCSLCHCYVCDIPAPCRFWGNGKLTTDHCHSTDKVEMWKELRVSFKQNNMVYEKVQNNTQPKLQQVQQVQNSIPTQVTQHTNSVSVAAACPRLNPLQPETNASLTASNKVQKKKPSSIQPVQETNASFTTSNEVQKKKQSSTQPVQKLVSPPRNSSVLATIEAPRIKLHNPKMSRAQTAPERVKSKTLSRVQPVQKSVTKNQLNSVSVTTASAKSSLLTQVANGNSGTLTAQLTESPPSIKKLRTMRSSGLKQDKSNNLPSKKNKISGAVQHAYNLRR